ncbi:sugar phosphate isomerase/epimerase family protein [Rhodopirellula sp. JC639]|uniref:sugar phosphate isomerase/epimerase family protein n=1 Tax=Stieleria mannarensis TaxID=2755585 RepID=UPI001600E031|nr:sugar phosphate isomerase/epimerase family protein [Rhodopirellula sp. JC639]
MVEWPIGLSTGCFYRHSIFECLEPIRAAGFDLIEICSFPSHLDYHDFEAVKRAGDLIQQLKLEPFAFHAPFAEQIDITSPDSAVRNRSVEEIVTAASAAAEIGVLYFVIHPGPEQHGLPEEERMHRMENAAHSLNLITCECAELNVGLMLENMMPHLFFGRPRDILWILGAIESTEVGICLDTGHAYLSGDLLSVAHKLSGHLWMVHASDNGGERDDHLPPGDGKIEWEPFIRQLERVHFEGPIILEVNGDFDPETTLDGAQRGRRFIREIKRHVEGANPHVQGWA